MDEQECILEIVDGVLTLVPKDKSATNSSEGKREDQDGNLIDFEISNNCGKTGVEKKPC